MSIARTDTNDDLAAWLSSVGRGDESAFARLYDSLASASYAVCGLSATSFQDDAMRTTWLYIWANAASLRLVDAPIRTVVLNIAHEMALRPR